MNETLKRCPFCGGEAKLQKGLCELDNYVMCLNCRCKTKLYNTKESAVKAWNRRAPLDHIIERLEVEGKLADEEKERCARENPLQFDSAKGYSTGIFNAIKIIKEEVG